MNVIVIIIIFVVLIVFVVVVALSGGGGGGGGGGGLPCNQYYVNGELRTCPEFYEYNQNRRMCEPISDIGCTAKKDPFVPSPEEFSCSPSLPWRRDHRYACNRIHTCPSGASLLSPQGMCWKKEGDSFVQVRCTALAGCRARGVIVDSDDLFDKDEIECTSENVGQTFKSRRNPCFIYFVCNQWGAVSEIVCPREQCSTGSGCGSCNTYRCGRYMSSTPMEIYAGNNYPQW